MVEWKHRGRVQAQGGGVEESVPWNELAPPTESMGHTMLDELRDKLLSAEQRFRESAFKQAHRFVKEAARGGGVSSPVRKTFLVRPITRENRRVDIEVHKGQAFVPDNVCSC
jgi:hypothetical protein